METDKKRIRVLAIESSCDETAAAVVDNGRTVLSNVISSQIDLHTLYGGVVPELASRKHIEKINQVIEQALKDADTSLDEIDVIGVTYGPGLVGALLVGVEPEDFGGDDPLAGVRFQRRWERAAFELGGGDYRAPAQRVGDFLIGVGSTSCGDVAPSYRPGVRYANLDDCLPGFVTETMRLAIQKMDRQLKGFASPGALLTGVETRSSSPVRITRGEDCQSSLSGLYPCGEGAGYAGGILSAAVDGMRVAEALLAAKGGRAL